MNNLNDSSNTSNDSSSTDLENRLPKNVISEALGQPTMPPAFMFKMTFPHLARYLGIKDKLTKRKDNPKQK